MRDYKYYLFDADGTLIDTTDLICKCFENTARVAGFKIIEKTDVLKSIGLTLRDQMTIHFGKLEDSVFEKYRAIHMDYQMSVYAKYLKLFSNVAETLKYLKANGKKCAVVTSRFRNSLDVYLKEMGIMEYFDALITPETTKHHKPHPEPVLKALESFNASANEALFIGDATFDIESGSSAGVDTAFVMWSINDISTLKATPTYYLKDMRELYSTI